MFRQAYAESTWQGVRSVSATKHAARGRPSDAGDAPDSCRCLFRNWRSRLHNPTSRGHPSRLPFTERRRDVFYAAAASFSPRRKASWCGTVVALSGREIGLGHQSTKKQAHGDRKQKARKGNHGASIPPAGSLNPHLYLAPAQKAITRRRERLHR